VVDRLIEQGLTSHQTHTTYRGWMFTGQMTRPTVLKHWRKIGPKYWASIPLGLPHRVTIITCSSRATVL